MLVHMASVVLPQIPTSLCQSVSQSVCLSVCVSIYLYLSTSPSLSLYYLSPSPLFLPLSHSLSHSLSLSLSLSISISLSLSLSLKTSVWYQFKGTNVLLFSHFLNERHDHWEICCHMSVCVSPYKGNVEIILQNSTRWNGNTCFIKVTQRGVLYK